MTIGWSSQPYHQRLKAGGMGDAAESMFEDVYKGTWVRFGFNRPPFRMTHLTSFVRHTPDYCTASGTLVECMGLGRDGVLKFKDEKYRALMEWNAKQPVMLFVWNSALDEHSLIQWPEVKSLVQKARLATGIREFNDGNEYWPIKWDWVMDKVTVS